MDQIIATKEQFQTNTSKLSTENSCFKNVNKTKYYKYPSPTRVDTRGLIGHCEYYKLQITCKRLVHQNSPNRPIDTLSGYK